jgi:hypothetical protein
MPSITIRGEKMEDNLIAKILIIIIVFILALGVLIK